MVHPLSCRAMLTSKVKRSVFFGWGEGYRKQRTNIYIWIGKIRLVGVVSHTWNSVFFLSHVRQNIVSARELYYERRAEAVLVNNF